MPHSFSSTPSYPSAGRRARPSRSGRVLARAGGTVGLLQRRLVLGLHLVTRRVVPPQRLARMDLGAYERLELLLLQALLGDLGRQVARDHQHAVAVTYQHVARI